MKVTNYKILSSNSEPASFISEVIEHLDVEIKGDDFRKSLNSNSIEFHRILKRTTNIGKNNRDTLKLLRAGKIELITKEKGKYSIKVTFNIDHLIYLTVIGGIALFLICWALITGLITSAVLTLVIMVIIFLFGLHRIKQQINNIVAKALKNSG